MTERNLTRFPYYAKITFVTLFIFLLFYIIYIGQSILLPLGFAFLFSVLLRPVEQLLLRWGVPKVISIMICMIIFILAIILLVTFVSHQVTSLADDLPRIKKSLGELWEKCQVWINEKLNLSYKKQQEIVDNAKDETMNSLAPQTLNLITGSFVTLTLLPVYIFLFLFYRTLFLEFLVNVFDQKHSENVKDVIHEVKAVIQQFITGILFETFLVAVLNVVGLLLIGAPYAILLGVVGAIMNTIPYIGGIVQLILSALIVFANTDSVSSMAWTIGVLVAVQAIDNYLLLPRIVGSRVKLNGLISIVGVLVGGAVAGIGGMFLSIPFMAICKIIFDRVEDLKPWGKLLGGEMSTMKTKGRKKNK